VTIHPSHPFVRRTGALVAVALLATSGLSACGGSTAKADAGKSVFTLGTTLGGTLDPIHADQVQADNPDQLFYDSLLSYDEDSELVPRLATEWTVAPDAKSITLTLRSDATFHDGNPVTAKDVVYTLDRLKSLNVGIASLLPGYESAVAEGDGKVVVKLSKPDTTALGALSRIYILNSALVAKHEGSDQAQGWLSEHEAGSGGYTLKSFTPNNLVTASRWSKYWDFDKGRPSVFRMNYIQESTAAKNALLSGGLDLAQDMTATDAGSFQGNAEFTTTPMEQSYEVYAVLNTQAPALKDVRVRKAIALAYDYKGSFEQVFGGAGAIGDGPLPKYLACRPDLPEAAQDVAEATRLVKEAGATGLKVKLFYQPTLTELTQTATLLASNLKTIGIEAELVTTTYPKYLDMLKSTKTTPDISMVYEGASFPDPGTVLLQTYDSQFVERGSNLSQYVNPKVDALVEEAIVTPDEATRCGLYEEAQKLIAADYTALPVALGGLRVVARKNVSGIARSPIHTYVDLMALRIS
jgi:peptide/nickel transport system substrate-binding protein